LPVPDSGEASTVGDQRVEAIFTARYCRLGTCEIAALCPLRWKMRLDDYSSRPRAHLG
jgi:hypothetical protein